MSDAAGRRTYELHRPRRRTSSHRKGDTMITDHCYESVTIRRSTVPNPAHDMHVPSEDTCHSISQQKGHTTMNDDQLLTITETAELLRTPVATLRWWRHTGKGPRSFKIGRGVRYRRSDLHAWIDQQHQEQSA
jgi:excisionase family DNA binding protein